MSDPCNSCDLMLAMDRAGLEMDTAASRIRGVNLDESTAPPAPEMGARLPEPDGRWHAGQDILPVPNRVRRMWQRAETKARVLWAALMGRPVIYRVTFTADAKVSFERPGVVADCVFPFFGVWERAVDGADGKLRVVLEPPIGDGRRLERKEEKP